MRAIVASLLVAGCLIGDAGSSIDGEVRDPAGHPLSGVRVYLVVLTEKGTNRYHRADSAVTDSAGCYHLFSLHVPGSIRVSYSRDGHRALELTAPGGTMTGRAVLEPITSNAASHGILQPLAGDSLLRCR